MNLFSLQKHLAKSAGALLLFFTITTNAQQSTQFEKDFSSIIKTNAEKLKKKSGSYSVSIGIIKDVSNTHNILGKLIKTKEIPQPILRILK